MSTWKERIRDELADLDVKLSKLELFDKSQVSQKQQALLWHQMVAMNGYKYILEQRLANE